MLEIRDAKKEEWEDAMALAWRTYLKFQAGEYPTEGTKSFFEFISNASLFELFIKGEYKLKVAILDEKIVGLCTMRNINHISLLFVDKEYHKQGIGKKLILAMCDDLKASNTKKFVTVNAAPNATEFYHKLGFFDLSGLTEKDGIIYTSMQRNI